MHGASCDTFAPFGEYVATKDEIPDPHNLRIQFRLNGETMQDWNTDDMIFDVPTLIEQGVPGFDLVAWFMLYAPSGLGAAQRDSLREAMQQVLAKPEVREKLTAQGVELADMNGEQMAAFGAAEIAKWGEAVRRSGAQID
mgnify:CR=1 FL=1